MPGNDAIETWRLPYVSSEYISSEITNKSCSKTTSAIPLKSCSVIIAPVGLLGNGSIRILVLSVTTFSSCSFLSLNSSSSFNSVITGTPSARTTQGS